MKVKSIVGVIPNAYKNMDKTTFISEDGKTAYTFARIAEGGEYDGDFTNDKLGNLQFKKSQEWKNNFGQNQSQTKEFKADPVKNASIERQVALKAAVELLAAKLPQMKEQPKTGELADAAIKIATKFDEFFKNNGETSSPKVVEEGVVEGEEIPFTDAEIDVEELELQI